MFLGTNNPLVLYPIKSSSYGHQSVAAHVCRCFIRLPDPPVSNCQENFFKYLFLVLFSVACFGISQIDDALPVAMCYNSKIRIAREGRVSLFSVVSISCGRLSITCWIEFVNTKLLAMISCSGLVSPAL